MYSSGDMNLKPLFGFLFVFAIIGAFALIGGISWGLVWLFTHISIAVI